MATYRAGATYARISKADADDLDGVTRQGEDTASLAVQRGVPVADRHRFVDNNLSATKGGPRSAYAALMRAVRAGDIDAVLVWSLSRLWRNRRERADGIDVFRTHGVSVLCVKGPELDMTSASGRLLAELLGAVDTHETEHLSERSEREVRQRVERGEPPTGPRAYGWTPDGMHVVPGEQSDVVGMYLRLLSGGSLSGIAAGLNSRGRTNRNGRPWTHNAVRNLLKNERNAGLRLYRGRLYPGAWPPLVSEDTWRAAVAVLNDPGRTSSPGPGRRWLLSGLALCGVCADGTTVTSGSRGSRSGQPPVPIYRCRRTKHLARATTPVDGRVADVVAARLRHPSAARLLVDESLSNYRELLAASEALRGRLSALADAWADDDSADVSEFQRASARLRGRLSAVQADMVHHERAAVLRDLVTAEDVGKAWDAAGLDRQRAALSLLFTVTLLPGKPGRAPFDPASVSFSSIPA